MRQCPSADDLEVRLRVEALDEPLTEDRVVLDHDDAHGGGRHTGIVPSGKHFRQLRCDPAGALVAKNPPDGGSTRRTGGRS
jgi:YD repeat-containing protein